MKLWGPGMWGFCVLFFVLLGSILIIDIKDMFSSEKVITYLVWAVLVVGFMLWNTKRQPDKKLWLHHYVIAGILVTFIAY